MKHIKNYLNKIEDIIAAKSAATKPSKKSSGLLKQGAKAEQPMDMNQSDIMLIAEYVKGIREAHMEETNGN